MKNAILTVAALAMISGSASAALLLSDDFESYTSQSNFEATWAPIGTVAPLSAEWSTAQSSSPTHSIRAPGTATTGQNRNRRSFAETGAPSITTQIHFSFDFYDVNGANAPQRNFVNLQDSTAPGSSNQLISLGLNNNQIGSDSGGQRYMARILGFTPTNPFVDPDGGPNETGTLSSAGSSPFVKLNDFGVGSRSTGWHNLKVIIGTDDGLSTDYAFYVDNVLAERVLNVGTTLRSYDNITLGSGLSNGSVEAFFDNIRLETVAVPEATAFVGVGLVGLLSVGGVWIRRRIRGAVVES